MKWWVTMTQGGNIGSSMPHDEHGRIPDTLVVTLGPTGVIGREPQLAEVIPFPPGGRDGRQEAQEADRR